MNKTESPILKVWWVRNPPNNPEVYIVSSIKQARDILNKLTSADLKLPHVLSNAGGLCVLGEDGEWEDWYCDTCAEDINTCKC